MELLVTSAKDAVKLEKFREKLPPCLGDSIGGEDCVNRF